MFTRRIENLDELMAFDRKHGIPSTFFVGVNNALGMSYSLSVASEAARRIKAGGFDVGVHGVAFDKESTIAEEFDKFKRLGIVDAFGIRNHYLRGRNDRRMHEWQAKAGYDFDSTDYGLEAPYKVGSMWEFPLSIMDSYVLKEYNNNIDQVKNVSIKMLEESEQKKLPFFTILFHNPSPVFPEHYEWYRWFILYLKDRGYEFISFKEAVNELSK